MVDQSEMASFHNMLTPFDSIFTKKSSDLHVVAKKGQFKKGFEVKEIGNNAAKSTGSTRHCLLEVPLD